MRCLSRMKICWVVIILLSLTSVVGLAKLKAKNELNLGNPASNYCLKRDGYLEIYSSPKGEVGICWFGQGAVEEWTLYQFLRGSQVKLKAIDLLLKNEHENGHLDSESARRNCYSQGGQVEILLSKERPDVHVALCRFSDQSAAESWTLYYSVNHFTSLKKLLIEE